MGAGSSTEQRSPEQPAAGSDTPSELELSGHEPAAEASGAAGDPADADPATKLPQKNGQLSTVNGVAEQDDVHVQEENQDRQEEEAIVEDVGQRESEDVKERDRAKEMAASSTVVDDITKDEQEETPEMLEQLPASEGNVEEMAQPAEAQANDVGFKKVFKFVGFKFTVKKDKNDKSDPAVQLLTVKKEEGEGAEASVAAGDHQEPGAEAAGESASKESELKQSTEKQDGGLQGGTESPLQSEPGQAPEEDDDEAKEDGEEKPTKSPESPTSPVSNETTSSFKKFFTHGWAGWRKKTSFKKAKEEDLEPSEKRKEQEADKADEEEREKTEPGPAAAEQEAAEGPGQPRLSADYEKVELPLEDQPGDLEAPPGDRCAPLATEVFDEKVDAHQEVVAEVHVSTVDKTTEEQGGGEVEGDVVVEGSRESLSPEKLPETQDAPQDAEPAEEPMKGKVCVSGGDHTQLRDLSPEEKGLPRHPEGLVSEVEMLSSQERIKAQGSPLKKLFSSSGLKKLSGKKQKGKRAGGGDEELEYQHVQSESPESADEQKGESSASSPDEPEEITSLEKGPSEAPQEGGETEEGATSDGEKKREGITPWASFKKMVTPKKRVRRPSESDKEEELDKVKSATLSSTESTASEMQDEAKAVVGDEQRAEEPKRRVDTSVSWEALICVGSSKKRARKASSSDDEGGPRTLGGDGHRVEEASKDATAGAEAAVPASAQEQDQAQGSSSPEPAGSPSEGEGVSTWESFKRLVTPRKKSKSKLEEKPEDAAGVEPTAEVEPSKEESWVSIKKFIPGRRKKRADGKQEHTAVEDAGPVEISEDDPDVPAVVPLSEYDAVERDKMEAQRARENVELPRLEGAVYVSEELSKTLVHTVSVSVIDGTRAVPGTEERSPSWISASVTEPLDHAEGEAAAPPVGEVTAKDVIAEETPTRTQALPEDKDDGHDVVVTSEVDLTSEAVTAAETTEALRAEEVTEAEETADMVSAVSQLTESPDTTEEATPVQEAEGGMLDTEEQERQTQAVLQAAADKVREGTQVPATQTVQRAGPTALEKVEELEEDSEVLATDKEKEVALQGPGQEGEHPARGPEAVQATPESLAGPEVMVAIDSVTTCQAVKPQQLMEQAMAPGSSETLTDSETNGSTPLADSDTPDGTQQDGPIESQERKAIAAGVGQPQVTEEEAAPAQEGSSTPPDLPAQEEHGQKPGRDVLEPTQQALADGAVPDLAKAEVGQEAEAGQIDGEKIQDGLCGKELEVSVPTGPNSQKIADVTHDGEATEVAGCQESQSPEEQSLSPEEREVGTDVEKGEMETKPERADEEHEQGTATPELGGAHPRPGLPVDTPHSESGTALGSLEGSPSLPDQDKAGCIEVKSPDTPVPQTAEAVKKVVETVAVSETDESLECVGAHLLPAEKSPETGGRGSLQPGGDTVAPGPESQAESIPIIVTPAPESALHPDLQGGISVSQKQRSDEDVKPDAGPDAEGKESTARQKVLKADPEISEIESKSSKIVQNVIQTAVDQFARTETAPETRTSDSQTQAPVAQADSQGAPQMLDKDESCRQVSAQGRTPSAAAQEGLAASDSSEGLGKASEMIDTLAVESARVKEGVEKLPLQSKDQKEHAADGPQLQSLAQAEADASGNLTKESPDTNGPKLTEEGDAPKVEVQEEEMNKAQTEEDLQEPKGDLAES